MDVPSRCAPVRLFRVTSFPGTAKLRAQRLASLLLADGDTQGPADRTPASIVEWFGAMQAQDVASAMWSLGVRLPGADQDVVTSAVNSGEIVRTWPMRGTVHLVPAADARWMVTILGERPLAGAARRREYLGLSEADAMRAGDVLGEALAGGGCLTRSECVEVMAAGGITGAESVTYHLLWFTSQRGITCNGPLRGKEQTFVLLDEWVPQHNDPSREEGLAIMAARYFRSHGPATKADFARWLGMTAGDAGRGIAAAGDALVTVATSDGPLLVSAEAPLAADPAALPNPRGVWVLPGFDEFILGYKNRDLVLAPERFAALVPGNNGIFRPTVVAGGQVIGTWTRTAKARSVRIEVMPFEAVAAATRGAAERAFARYAEYLESPADVTWHDPV